MQGGGLQCGQAGTGTQASERNLRSLRERWHWEVQRAWGSGIRNTQVQVQLPHLPAAGYLPSQGRSLFIFRVEVGTSLVVQWLKPLAPNAGHAASIPGQGTRFHMSQLRVCMPHSRSHMLQQRQRPGAGK